MKNTIKAKLVARQDGLYSNYVFQNLDEEEQSELRYITVTKCPNWQFFETLNFGDVGFLEYEYAEAGDKYYDKSTDSIQSYKHTALYFINFIKEKENNLKEFKL